MNLSRIAGLFVIAALLLLNPKAMAKPDYIQMVKTSLEQLRKTNQSKTWAFTKTTSTGKDQEHNIRIETFDPNKPDGQQWQLLSDNGQAPDVEQLQQYHEFKAKELAEMEKQQQAGEEQSLAKMVNFDSLKVEQQQGQQIILSFTPELKQMGKGDSDKLNGRMIFDTKTQQVQQLKITNSADLSPAPAVTLKQFSMEFELKPIKQVLLPAKIAIDIYGKAAWVKTIEQNSQEVYSNYRYVGR